MSHPSSCRRCTIRGQMCSWRCRSSISKGCDRDGNACANLGIPYLDGRGLQKNPAKLLTRGLFPRRLNLDNSTRRLQRMRQARTVALGASLDTIRLSHETARK